MVMVYVNLIIDGKRTLATTPSIIREQVRVALIAECIKRIKAGRMTLDKIPEEVRDEVLAGLETFSVSKSSTIPEIKTFLDNANVDYPSKATKDELLKLAEEV